MSELSGPRLPTCPARTDGNAAANDGVAEAVNKLVDLGRTEVD